MPFGADGLGMLTCGKMQMRLVPVLIGLPPTFLPCMIRYVPGHRPVAAGSARRGTGFVGEAPGPVG
jgi:hypothetical protein